ncbi:hypothetical protein ACFX2J_028856 [Malus domestica]
MGSPKDPSFPKLSIIAFSSDCKRPQPPISSRALISFLHRPQSDGHIFFPRICQLILRLTENNQFIL